MECVESAIRDYLKARRHFLGVARQHPEELRGNDNIIGRIGEYLAIKYLRANRRKPHKPKSRSQEGYDLVDKRRRISVKVLTDENENQRGTRLRQSWDEFLLISFSTARLEYRIGHLQRTQFKKALREHPRWSLTPIVKRSMLSRAGLIGHYGTVTETLRLDVEDRSQA